MFFPKAAGKPYSQMEVHRAFKEAVKKAGK
jgi:predicted RNA-binding protein